MNAAETIRRFDAIIAGAGPTGTAMALALAHLFDDDITIALVDRAPPTQAGPPGDPRAWALSVASVRFLDGLGVWPGIAGDAQPVTGIDITDSSLEAGIRPVLLHYDNVTEDGEPGAWIVPNQALLQGLERGLAARPAGTVTAISGSAIDAIADRGTGIEVATDAGARYAADILIGADGRRSTIRRLAGIKTVRFDYDQAGIVTTVTHDRPHDGKAVQHFLPGGPFAILPLPGNRACITWSEDRTRAEAIMAGDDASFSEEVQRRFGGRLGRVTVTGGRALFPLSTEISRSFIAPHIALVGDAARGVHPIAGQGLNLAFRDCAALAECLADAARAGLALGEITALARYQRWRRFDSALSAGAFDVLNRLFSNDVALLRSLREVGLGVVDRSDTLKRFFVKEAAGLSGDVPLLMR